MGLTKLQIISISCGVGAIVLAIIVGVIPFVMENNIKSSFQKKTNPTKNNTDYWARFPGKLDTSLLHSFRFISENQGEFELSPAETTYEEKVFYDDFVFNDETNQISFTNKREFEKKSVSVGKVKTVSLGMLEMFNTLSNPPFYKEAISSMMYLIHYSFGSPEDFIRRLFTHSAFKEIIQVDEKLAELLKEMEEDKKTKIKEDPNYGLLKLNTFYKWIMILGDEELIKKATWLTDALALTEEEKQKLLGVNSMLYGSLKTFNDNLVTKFNCFQTPCGNELIYLQIIEQTVTEYIGQSDMKNMLLALDDKSYPFNYPLEMNHYYSYLKRTDYEKDKLTIEQLKLMFDLKSEHVLFEPSNAITLLNLNLTQNLTNAEAKFVIKTKEQLAFVADYIFRFLPNNFLYGSFKVGGTEYKIDSLTKTYTSLMSLSVDQTYGKLINNNNLYVLIVSKMVFVLIEKDFKPNVCPILLQRILGDGIRVRQICANKQLNMEDLESIKLWVKTYFCKKNNCQTEMKDYIKKIVFISDKEFDKIFFSDDSIGIYIKSADEKALQHYKCGNRCSEEYLALKQYTSCEITKNPPDELPKTDSISDWDKIDYPQPIELKYYQDKSQCKEEDCNDQSNEAFMNLYGINAEIINKKSAQGVYLRNLFEKIYTLIINDKEDTEMNKLINVKTAKNYFNSITKIITSGMLQNTNMIEYSYDSILSGNNAEDKFFIDLLQKGSPYDYYNLKASKTTGFALEKKDEIKTDQIVIDAIQSTNKTLRAIKQMNNATFMSINKKDYSPIKNEMVDVISPIFSNYTFNDEKWASDGFQYSGDLKDIYFYDELSSRILQFTYDRSRAYQNMTCYEYILNTNLNPDLREERDIQKNGFGEASKKFNKPFIVSASNNPDNVNITELEKKNSFICVDPYSNMVLESNISLIYSVSTKNYNSLNSQLQKDQLYPFILYNRNYSMDSVSYSMNFEGLSGYYTGRLLLIILGIIFIVLLVGLCVFFWYKNFKETQGDILEKSTLNVNDNLIPKTVIDDTKFA